MGEGGPYGPFVTNGLSYLVEYRKMLRCYSSVKQRPAKTIFNSVNVASFHLFQFMLQLSKTSGLLNLD